MKCFSCDHSINDRYKPFTHIEDISKDGWRCDLYHRNLSYEEVIEQKPINCRWDYKKRVFYSRVKTFYNE